MTVRSSQLAGQKCLSSSFRAPTQKYCSLFQTFYYSFWLLTLLHLNEYPFITKLLGDENIRAYSIFSRVCTAFHVPYSVNEYDWCRNVISLMESFLLSLYTEYKDITYFQLSDHKSTRRWQYAEIFCYFAGLICRKVYIKREPVFRRWLREGLWQFLRWIHRGEESRPRLSWQWPSWYTVSFVAALFCC